MRIPVAWAFRAIMVAAGFWRVKYIGKKASTAEAPIKVGAPHLGFIEPVAFMCMNLGMFIAEESNITGLVDWMTRCMQPILFDRFAKGRYAMNVITFNLLVC